jgi:hypothetical protein
LNYFEFVLIAHFHLEIKGDFTDGRFTLWLRLASGFLYIHFMNWLRLASGFLYIHFMNWNRLFIISCLLQWYLLFGLGSSSRTSKSEKWGESVWEALFSHWLARDHLGRFPAY